MGFFDSRPAFVPPPEEEHEHPPQPEWFGPPDAVLPGYVPDRAVLFRTADAVFVVGRFDAYRTGLEFALDLYVRDGFRRGAMHDIPWERQHRPSGDPGADPDDILRFGIACSDGSSWSNLDPWYPKHDEPPAAPFVMSRGGGGDRDHWRMRQWLWPLPPPGPLTFVAEWPKYGIAESQVTFDAAKLRAAADDAIDLWG